MKGIKKSALFLLVLFASMLFIQKGECVYAGVKIVLDPGHDSTHTGASANGIQEDVVNYKIAKYCYEELQNYDGITGIYMTRNGYDCPFPGTTSTQDNKKRVEFAKSVGANVFVSIHNNSSSNSSAKGASVYYPNANYNSSIGTAGKRLANIVQSHLIALGLENRGTHIRDSEDNTRYADGSLADYYGVIKNSKLSGFAGIIIEHAFLTNSSDVANYLSTDAQLKLLGIADATGIAEYYGLSKKALWDGNVSNAKATASFSSDYRSSNIKITGLEKAPGVWIAVWSSENGLDDIKWYAASNDGLGNWNYSIPVSEFKSTGKYNVHVYVKDSEMLYACETSYNVQAPSATGIVAKDVDFNSGTFKAEVSGVTANPGISYVLFAVWTKSDGSDIKWINATASSDSVYTANINMRDFGYHSGYYYIHAYGCDNNGMSGILKTLNYAAEYPAVNISAVADGDDIEFSIKVSNLLFVSDILDVYVDIWSEENGEDDKVRYKMSRNGDSWIYSDYLLSHMTSGNIHVKIYETLNTNVQILVGSAVFTPSGTDSEQFFEAKISDDNSLIWSGSKTRVIIKENAITEVPDVTAPAVLTSQEAVVSSSEAVSTGGVEAPDSSGLVSTGVVETPDSSGLVSTGVVDIMSAGQAVPVEKLKNMYLLREKIYSFKESINLYLQVKNALVNDNEFVYKSFYLQSAKLLIKSDYADYLNKNLTGKEEIQFKLPEKYRGKNIKVIEFSNENDTIELKNSYITETNEEGYASIFTDIGSKNTGNFIVTADWLNKHIGDVDFNGSVDLDDVMIMLKGALGVSEFSAEQKSVADINGDGNIDLEDVLKLLRQALGVV